MYALGRDGLPGSVVIDAQAYTLERQVKHDFWAATGFYQPAESSPRDRPARIVVKVNRQTRFLIIPLRWIGRWLARREIRAYEKLKDLPQIPMLLGGVADTGFAHAYVEGAPLNAGRPVPDGFFDELFGLIDEMRGRGIAYVDTNKPENILLTDSGSPCLIDFQISFDAAAWWPRWAGRWWLRRFHAGDVYHILKQKRRFRPDLLSEADRVRLGQRGWLHELHRWISMPYRWIRRPLMRKLIESGRILPEQSK